MGATEYDAPYSLMVRTAHRHDIDPRRMREGRKPEELRARREWIRLVQDSWGLTISETARLLGVDRCAVRGARR